ncbi:hypothetical protein [Mycobacteroides abscessus]|uniref:hypothetical protein n=1 Tax=Mycobacteroides abscessus TaxID=36809 RepID=UPI00092BE3E5|nr:hypothetical protein [Mycobacteroides abscessus]SHW30932.1 Uncharacterised protein [Mycobacteroides abscessus subsp. abscessus]SHZ71822.1 Uncharacterised protein [Mycobacteroides abscessus subsp. abscessus]SKQ71857.1 Uncharacterised protein [Mycobacteroides abscessus subsp. abscessus]
MNQDVAAESPNNTKKLFAIKEIHTHDGYDGRPISYEHIVSTDGNEDDVAIGSAARSGDSFGHAA